MKYKVYDNTLIVDDNAKSTMLKQAIMVLKKKYDLEEHGAVIDCTTTENDYMVSLVVDFEKGGRMLATYMKDTGEWYI